MSEENKLVIDPCERCGATKQSRYYVDTHDVMHVRCETCPHEWVE